MLNTPKIHKCISFLKLNCICVHMCEYVHAIVMPGYQQSGADPGFPKTDSNLD
jgi:hypothetical protein